MTQPLVDGMPQELLRFVLFQMEMLRSIMADPVSFISIALLVLAVVAVGAVAYGAFRMISMSFKHAMIARALHKQGLHYPKSTLPLLGNTLDVMIFQKHRLHDWMTDQSCASGGKPWILSVVGQPPVLMVSSPEAFEDVLKTQFDAFGRGGHITEVGHDFFGDGIVGVDGPAWVHKRRVASQLFTTQMLRNVMEDAVIEKTEKLCAVLETFTRDRKRVSMKSLLGTYTADVFTKVALGFDLNGLDDVLMGNLEREHPFIKAVGDFGETFQSRMQSPVWYWKLRRLLNIGIEGRFKRSAKIVNDLIHNIMLKSLDKSSKDASARRFDLLTLLVEANEDADVVAVRDTVMNFFLAGHDTTAFSLSWFLVMMNRHPHVLRKIREEIRTNLPDLGRRAPTFAELQRLPYLEAAIKESTRLHMTAMPRMANQATTLSDGTFVPAGTAVIMSVFVAARMTSTWGPGADQYRPERFINEATGALKVVSPFKFASFSGGARQCIGMRFAMLKMKTAMAAVLSRFDLKTVENPHDITYDFSIVLPVKGDLLMTVQDQSAVAEGE